MSSLLVLCGAQRAVVEFKFCATLANEPIWLLSELSHTFATGDGIAHGVTVISVVALVLCALAGKILLLFAQHTPVNELHPSSHDTQPAI